MATKTVTLGQTDALTVNVAATPAPTATPTSAAAAALLTDVEAQSAAAQKFASAYAYALEEAAQRRPALEAGSIGIPATPGLLWNVMTAGPFLLSGVTAPAAPPARPNRVVPSGANLLILGVSWAANPLTIGYLNSKDYAARFEIANMSTVTPGPSVTMSGPAFAFGNSAAFSPTAGVIATGGGAFHIFYWIFNVTVPGGPAAATQCCDINFMIDIKPFGIPAFASAGGAFAEWHWDPDNSVPMPNPILLPVTPGTAAGWRFGTANRIGVFPFPG